MPPTRLDRSSMMIVVYTALWLWMLLILHRIRYVCLFEAVGIRQASFNGVEQKPTSRMVGVSPNEFDWGPHGASWSSFY